MAIHIIEALETFAVSLRDYCTVRDRGCFDSTFSFPTPVLQLGVSISTDIDPIPFCPLHHTIGCRCCVDSVPVYSHISRKVKSNIWAGIGSDDFFFFYVSA